MSRAILYHKGWELRDATNFSSLFMFCSFLGQYDALTPFALTITGTDIKRANHFYKWGLDAYRKMQFDQAISLFSQACDLSSDNASKVFIERCKYFLQNPPSPQTWGDGTWNLRETRFQRRFSRIIVDGYSSLMKRKLSDMGLLDDVNLDDVSPYLFYSNAVRLLHL